MIPSYSKKEELPLWLSRDCRLYPLVMSFPSRDHVPAGESLPHSFPSDSFLVNREMGEMRDCLEEVNEPTGCCSGGFLPFFLSLLLPRKACHARMLHDWSVKCNSVFDIASLNHVPQNALQELINAVSTLCELEYQDLIPKSWICHLPVTRRWQVT